MFNLTNMNNIGTTGCLDFGITCKVIIHFGIISLYKLLSKNFSKNNNKTSFNQTLLKTQRRFKSWPHVSCLRLTRLVLLWDKALLTTSRGDQEGELLFLLLYMQQHQDQNFKTQNIYPENLAQENPL